MTQQEVCLSNSVHFRYKNGQLGVSLASVTTVHVVKEERHHFYGRFVEITMVEVAKNVSINVGNSSMDLST